MQAGKKDNEGMRMGRPLLALVRVITWETPLKTVL